MAQNMVKRVVGIVISLILVGVLLPIGLETLLGASLENAPASVETLVFTFIPIMAVIAIAYMFIKDFQQQI